MAGTTGQLGSNGLRKCHIRDEKPGAGLVVEVGVSIGETGENILDLVWKGGILSDTK